MIGTQIGNYRITGKLGEGGMGAVFLAEHALLGRQAAIKVLLREMSHRQELVTRFFNEARAATAVKHPGIVEIYDFGYHTDGSAYIVMEYLEGESLQTRLRRVGVLPESRAAALGRQVASALAAAHAKGIVHRDLKPDNIFVVRDPDTADGERTKILDFGIAKLAHSEQPGAVATRTGMVMGTPMYMSPEQCKGAGQVDHRADLYALGCILFEMVCGRHVFLAEGSGEVMAHHIFTAPPAPSSIRPVSPQLEQIILRALAKDPAHRFQSADELIAALQGAVPSGAYPSPVEARPSWSGPAVQPMMVPTPAPMPMPMPVSTPAPMTPAPAMHATPAPVLSPSMATALIATPMQQTTLSEAISSGVTVPPARRRPWLVAAVALGTLGAVGGAIALSGGGAGSASATPASAPAVAAAAPAATTAPDAAPAPVAATSPDAATAPVAATVPDAAPAPAPTITLTITSEPAGAEVFVVRGTARESLGVTPIAKPMPPGADALALVVKKHGFADAALSAPGDRDSTQAVVLKRPRAGGKRPPSGSTGATPTGSLDPFEKLPNR